MLSQQYDGNQATLGDDDDNISLITISIEVLPEAVNCKSDFESITFFFLLRFSAFIILL